jgi:hypothetical protein
LVDCSKANSGCNGGLAPSALDYIKANGITTEDAYPYVKLIIFNLNLESR